ncbi:hypothetical protein K8R30_00505 [archaeon]|nr:hypothetical protein [archaeon]
MVNKKMGVGTKGQVAIFFMVSIVIVAMILLSFLLLGETGVDRADNLDPRTIVRGCVSDLVKDSVDKMMRNGGEAVPSQAILYEGEEWNYLCYQADFYQGCYNIHPMLELRIESEIKEDISGGVESCFDRMRESFRDEGFDVEIGVMSFSVDLLPGYVKVDLSRQVDISGDMGTQSSKDFGIEVVSPIYDLVSVARDVVNSESQFCNFEYNGYMLLYPRYDIRRIDYSGSKIYRLIDRRSGDEFRFAVRSCAFAPGI